MTDGSFYQFGKLVTPPQVSIHPRCAKGRTVRPLKNTAAPRSERNGGQGSKTLRKVAKRLATRVKNWDVKNAGTRKPGSMQP